MSLTAILNTVHGQVTLLLTAKVGARRGFSHFYKVPSFVPRMFAWVVVWHLCAIQVHSEFHFLPIHVNVNVNVNVKR